MTIYHNSQVRARSRVSVAVLGMTGTTIDDGGAISAALGDVIDAIPEALAGASQQDIAHMASVIGSEPTRGLFRRVTSSEDDARMANAVFDMAFARRADQFARPKPGAESAIDMLRTAGISVVLSTGFSNGIRDLLVSKLKWHGLIDAALSASDAGRAHPYPDIELTALMRSGGTTVEELLVAGDQANDVRAGIHAGAEWVVGVLGGVSSESELRVAGATAIIDAVADLPALLGLG